MKELLLLATGLCFFCACQKSEPAAPTAVVYPYKDQFTGTLHVFHKYGYWMPTLTFDSTYTQTFEVVYLDSNQAFFNFYYWDYGLNLNYGVASYSRILTSTSSINTIGGLSQFNMKVGVNGLAVVSDDSLVVSYPAITAAYNTLAINFAGKKK